MPVNANERSTIKRSGNLESKSFKDYTAINLITDIRYIKMVKPAIPGFKKLTILIC
jgi:hypothetical protein